MIISCSKKVTWKKVVHADPLLSFGKESGRKLRQTLARGPEAGIRYEVVPITEEFYEWFVPRYVHTIEQKSNAHVHDIRAHINAHDGLYEALVVWEGDVRRGAMVFRMLESSLSVAFSSFDHSWNSQHPASPPLYAEYSITEHAYARGKLTIVHGRDRNPFGLNASIGLCIFKLSVGCLPVVPKTLELQTIDTDVITEDALILLLPEDGVQIVKAILVTTPEREAKYAQLQAYSDRIAIDVVYRSQGISGGLQ